MAMLFKPAKRCPFCAHKLDATTKLCTNANCIDYNGKLTKNNKNAVGETVKD